MSAKERVTSDEGEAVLHLYDRALPQVYGYLLSRCGSPAIAEDLTAETFLAAVDAVKRRTVSPLTTAWLVGVARHKLVDHWRRGAREERMLDTTRADGDAAPVVDPWNERIDAAVANAVLDGLASHHRAALTLRYLDGLSVPEVAEVLGRTLHATEALLVRARVAFRRAYHDRKGE